MQCLVFEGIPYVPPILGQNQDLRSQTKINLFEPMGKLLKHQGNKNEDIYGKKTKYLVDFFMTCTGSPPLTRFSETDKTV